MILAGTFLQALTIGTSQLSAPGRARFIVKLDGAGQVLWTQKLPRAAADFTPDAAGNVFLAGAFESRTHFGTNVLVSMAARVTT